MMAYFRNFFAWCFNFLKFDNQAQGMFIFLAAMTPWKQTNQFSQSEFFFFW